MGGRLALLCAMIANNLDVVSASKDIATRKRRDSTGLSISFRPSNAKQTVRETQLTMFNLDGESVLSDSDESQLERIIPPAYEMVVEQIEAKGWHKINWESGNTMLHWAAKHDHVDLIKRFMDKRADPNHRDDDGKSALDYAHEHNNINALWQLGGGR